MVKYHLLYRDYEEQPIPESGDQTLLTDGNQSAFFGRCDTIESFGGMLAFYRDYTVYKNLPTEGKLTYMDNNIDVGAPLSYVEEMPEFEWNFLDGDTTIASYPCKKASMTFRGRSWTVWYAMDIPVGDGPWKLCGLPGLILYAVDSKSDFSFEAIEIKHVDNVVIDMIKARKSSMKEIERLRKLKYSDVTAYYKEILNSPPMEGMTKGGPKTACLLEYIEEK